MPDFFAQIIEGEGRAQREARMPGLVFAEVSAVTGDGLFELRFLSHHSTEPSAPARLATLMAGGGRGTVFRPEVGDEVVVGFELGDIARPIILGAVFSDQDQEPSDADTTASNNKRLIVSRMGHQIVLDDTSGAGKVIVKTKGGMEITLDDSPPGKIVIKTTGIVATSTLELDGVKWNHQHATGVGPSGPPVSIGG